MNNTVRISLATGMLLLALDGEAHAIGAPHTHPSTLIFAVAMAYATTRIAVVASKRLFRKRSLRQQPIDDWRD